MLTFLVVADSTPHVSNVSKFLQMSPNVSKCLQMFLKSLIFTFCCAPELLFPNVSSCAPELLFPAALAALIVPKAVFLRQKWCFHTIFVFTRVDRHHPPPPKHPFYIGLYPGTPPWSTTKKTRPGSSINSSGSADVLSFSKWFQLSPNVSKCLQMFPNVYILLVAGNSHEFKNNTDVDVCLNGVDDVDTRRLFVWCRQCRRFFERFNILMVPIFIITTS